MRAEAPLRSGFDDLDLCRRIVFRPQLLFQRTALREVSFATIALSFFQSPCLISSPSGRFTHATSLASRRLRP
jgi:hypothetical protein